MNNKNGLIECGLIAAITATLIFLGAMCFPEHFGLLGEFFASRWEAMSSSQCFEAGYQEIPECWEIRSK